MEVCLASSVRVRRCGDGVPHTRGAPGDGAEVGAREPRRALQATCQVLEAFWGGRGGGTAWKRCLTAKTRPSVPEV